MSPRKTDRQTVLVTGTRAPAGLHAARLFHNAGYRVVAADSARMPLSLADRRKYPTVRSPSPALNPDAFALWMKDLVRTEQPRLIFPSCEEVFHLRHALDAMGLEVDLCAPPRDLLFRAHSKAEFPVLLRDAGLAEPKTVVLGAEDLDVSSERDLREYVLKREYSRFATETILSPGAADLQRAGRCNSRWVIQERLAGEEVCVYAIAHKGLLTAFCAYLPRYRAGHGAGIYFEPLEHRSLHDYVARFAEATGWTGQLGMDVFLTPDRGPVAIECNPRATSGIHLFGEGTSFAGAAFGSGEAKRRAGPRMIGPAMLGFGLRHTAPRHWRAWARDWVRGEDALVLPGFGSPTSRMLLAAAGFWAQGLATGIGTLPATTRDIAWDG